MADARRYITHISAVENQKGVLDLDTVKGCREGMKAHKGGCYGQCYAAKIANYRGIDFSTSVARYPQTATEMKAMLREVVKSDAVFVRIGTMGDPSHDWPGTVRVARFVAQAKPVVIVTKHWLVASDDDLYRMAEAKVTINTSVSALDTDEELEHRLGQHYRYREAGGNAVLRIVTVDALDPDLKARQEELMGLERFLDTPLRVPLSYRLAVEGKIRVRRVQDLNSEASISLWKDDVFLGLCKDCPDVCGIDWNKEKA